MRTEVEVWINNFYKTFRENAIAESRLAYYDFNNMNISDLSIYLNEIFRKIYHAGYCWHFAHTLKSVFERGTVCWAAPFSHFVWQDEDGKIYDCEGIYNGEAYYFIPEDKLDKDKFIGFRHIEGKSCDASYEYLIEIMKTYCVKNNIEYDKKAEYFLKRVENNNN